MPEPTPTPTTEEAVQEFRDLCSDIADAIREKTGESGTINAQNFASIIRTL